MPTLKLQTSRALPIIKSDNCDIPYPAISSTGTNSSAVTDQLVDTAGLFITKNISTGDIIYNNTDSLAAVVVEVISETVLKLNADIFAADSKTYTIYQKNNHGGALIYVGGTGNITGVTAGGDNIVLTGVLAGKVIPINFIKVKAATTATALVALW